jgi:membrane protein
MARGPSGDPPAPRPFRWLDARAAGELGWRVGRNFAEDRVTFLAGGVTYFVLLGIFPALSAFLAFFGLYADPTHAPRLLDWFQGAVPADVLTYVGRQMTRLAAQKPAALSLQFAGSLAFWIWSADAAVKALIYGLNLAHRETDTRGFFAYTWLTLRFTLAFLVVVLLVSGLMLAAPRLEARLGTHLGFHIWRWPAMCLGYLGLIWPLYRYGPCRKPGRDLRILPGALLATALSLAASLLFNWYLAYSTRLNAAYHPLGGAVAFMLWTWLTVSAVLAGGELNGELERRGVTPPASS